MKKQLATAFALMLATGAVVAAPTVSLYGLIDDGFIYTDAKGESPTLQMQGSLQSGSRWGIKTQENFGNGNYVFANLEAQFDSDSGEVKSFHGNNNDFFGRWAVVGVGNKKYGEVLMGRLPAGTSAYGRDPMLPLTDAFKCAWQDASTLGITRDNTYRLNNAIQAWTGDLHGFKAAATFSFSRFKHQETGGFSDNDRFYDLAMRYKGKQFFLFLGGNKTDLASGKDGPSNIIAGGNYDFGKIKAFLQYRHSEHLTSVGAGFKGKGDWKTDGVMLGLQYRPVASGLLMAGVKFLNAKSEAATTDGKFQKKGLSLGYQYFFSKRTDAYLIGSYTWANKAADKAATENRTQVMCGLRHRF